jgi:hypothetical protein
LRRRGRLVWRRDEYDHEQNNGCTQ